MRPVLQHVAAWLTSLLRDPNDASVSTARLCAVLCVVVACVVALWSVHVRVEYAQTVTALLGGGAASLFARTRSQPS